MSIREFGVMGLFPDEVIAKNEMRIRRASPIPARRPDISQRGIDFRNDDMNQRITRKENRK